MSETLQDPQVNECIPFAAGAPEAPSDTEQLELLYLESQASGSDTLPTVPQVESPESQAVDSSTTSTDLVSNAPANTDPKTSGNESSEHLQRRTKRQWSSSPIKNGENSIELSDITRVDTNNRIRRPNRSYMSNAEIMAVDAHKEQIRAGLSELQAAAATAEAAAQTRTHRRATSPAGSIENGTFVPLVVSTSEDMPTATSTETATQTRTHRRATRPAGRTENGTFVPSGASVTETTTSTSETPGQDEQYELSPHEIEMMNAILYGSRVEDVATAPSATETPAFEGPTSPDQEASPESSDEPVDTDSNTSEPAHEAPNSAEGTADPDDTDPDADDESQPERVSRWDKFRHPIYHLAAKQFAAQANREPRTQSERITRRRRIIGGLATLAALGVAQQAGVIEMDTLHNLSDVAGNIDLDGALAAAAEAPETPQVPAEAVTPPPAEVAPQPVELSLTHKGDTIWENAENLYNQGYNQHFSSVDELTDTILSMNNMDPHDATHMAVGQEFQIPTLPATEHITSPAVPAEQLAATTTKIDDPAIQRNLFDILAAQAESTDWTSNPAVQNIGLMAMAGVTTSAAMKGAGKNSKKNKAALQRAKIQRRSTGK